VVLMEHLQAQNVDFYGFSQTSDPFSI